MNKFPDPKDLKSSVLISNTLYTQDMEYRKKCMEELDLRLPQGAAQLREAVQGEVSSTVETQNLDQEQMLHIEVDFSDVWDILGKAIQQVDSGRLKARLQEVQSIFQNPAFIKPKDWMSL